MYIDGWNTDHLCVSAIFYSDFPGERELDENIPIRTQLKTPDGKRPSVFLRFREKNPDRGYIRVYPGALRCVVCLCSYAQKVGPCSWGCWVT